MRQCFKTDALRGTIEDRLSYSLSEFEHPGTGQAKPYAVRDCAVRGMVSYAD